MIRSTVVSVSTVSALPLSTIPAPDWSAGPSGYHVGIAVAAWASASSGRVIRRT